MDASNWLRVMGYIMELVKRLVSAVSVEGIQLFLLLSIVVVIALNAALKDPENPIGAFGLIMAITLGVSLVLIVVIVVASHWILSF